jgi:hypothetical protein
MQKGKHGKVNISTSTNKYVFTDTELLIRDSHQHANESGLRSIVVHAANGGASRIACATLGRQLIASFTGTGEVLLCLCLSPGRSDSLL